VAWFTIAAKLGKPITLYGDGWQLRDVLNVKDLSSAYHLAWENRSSISGQAFNIGGGPDNTLCLRDLITLLESELDLEINPKFAETRPGDQPVFVCDIRKAKEMLGWTPEIDVYTGVKDLIDWVNTNVALFA
jgi:CDP-paratose 2-epimerase